MALFDLLWSSRFVTEMLLACFLVALPHKKREGFGLRAALLCLAAEGISLLVMNSGGAQAVWTDPVYTTVSCLIYMGVFFALALAFFLLLCPVTVREALYCTALSMTVQHISSALVLLLTALIPGEGYLFETALWLVTIVVPYMAVYFWCILPICEKGAYQFNVLNLTSTTLLIFLVSAFISSFAKGLDLTGREPLFLICQVYEILCCCFLLWLQVSQKEAISLQHELDIQDYLRHLRHEQSQQARREMELTNHLMHELKHQVADMLKEQSEDDRDRLLDEIADNLTVYDENIDTRNETLNTVIQERSLFCRANHISWMCVADGASLDFIQTGDLYLIFRNALDNAIDAVCQLPDPQRRVIDVKVYTRNALLMIQIENRFQGRLQFENGLPVTTKGDRSYYGYGLKTIRSIAERYGGCITVRAKNELFSLQVMIPVPKP
ncbi:MAG: GHKL domain-containing protein [Clostridiales bacterium]|nr:GHKL domain-containing protein [Clostridiales bacterium]